MRHIRQTQEMNCGQACIAMIAGVSLTAAHKAVGHNRGTRTPQLLRALRKLGYVPTHTKAVRCFRPFMLPKRALVRFSWQEHEWVSKTRCRAKVWYHVAVYWDGVWYDPGYEKGTCLLHHSPPEHCARMTSYLPLA